MSPARAQRPPEALLIDLDDTILDGSHNALGVDGTCAAIAATFPELEERQVKAAYADAWTDYRPAAELSYWLGRLDGASVYLETWRRALRRCGRADDGPARFAVRTYRRIARSAYRPFPDVAALFSTTARLGIPVVLVTNGPSDIQREKLRALGMERSFEAVLISGEVGAAKPDPALFSTALDRVGVEPPAAWHVGDGLTNDVGGAHAAGLVAVWLNRTGRPTPTDDRRPDLEVTSLDALSQHLTRRGPAGRPPAPRPDATPAPAE